MEQTVKQNIIPGVKACRTGKCQICDKDTQKTCPKCLSVFYCNSDHRNQDRKIHKKSCVVVKGPPTLQMVDVCDIAASVFTEDFLIPDKKVGFAGTVPFGIKNVGDGKKYYCVQEITGMSLSNSEQAWYNAGYKPLDFWSVFCLDKSRVFHYAFVSALRSIVTEKGYNIEHEGKPIMIFGTSLVEVVKEYDTIVALFEWPGNDPDGWRKLDIQTKMHEVVWFSTGKGDRYLVDFTGPSYGVYEFNKNSKPLFISHYDKQKHYVINKLAFPDDADRIITELVQQQKDQFKDWKPLMALGAKNSIIERCCDN